MKTATIFALSALSALVAAAPVNKRDVVWVTKTREFVETVVITTTIYPHATYTEVATAAEVTTTPGEFYQGPTHKPKYTKRPTKKTSTQAPVETSSVYVAPSPSTPSSTYVAPTSTYVPPTTSTPAYTPPATSSPAAAATPTYGSGSSSSGSSGGGEEYTGEMTYYTPGLGACGWTNTESEDIVALAAGMMGEQSNGNPWCGKMISITYKGATHSAKIVDKCPGCIGAGLDLSPTLFEKFADLGEGRLYDATWTVE